LFTVGTVTAIIGFGDFPGGKHIDYRTDIFWVNLQTGANSKGAAFASRITPPLF
jgi:hypothetical protein